MKLSDYLDACNRSFADRPWRNDEIVGIQNMIYHGIKDRFPGDYTIVVSVDGSGRTNVDISWNGTEEAYLMWRLKHT